MTGRLFIISAPSGAGKTSLVNALIDSMDDISVCVSHTTRAPRPGEKDGVDYHFTDVAAFERKAASGEFLEHARVFGHLYGTSKKAVQEQLDADKDIVLEIDWQGARQIRRLFEDAVSIFIVPPTLEELRVRLEHRGRDDRGAIEQRMQDAIDHISHFHEYDYLVVNAEFHRALADLQAIAHAARLRTPVQRRRMAAAIERLMAGGTAI
jgi:guanylate kinase